MKLKYIKHLALCLGLSLIKMTLRFHLTPFIMAKFKISGDSRWW